MNVGETVVLVRHIDGVGEGTYGWVKGRTADRVVVECKVRERPEVVLAHIWDVLPARLWERHLRRRSKLGGKGVGGYGCPSASSSSIS